MPRLETKNIIPLVNRQFEQEYFRLLRNAKSKIYLAVYGFRTTFNHPRYSKSPINDLAKELKNAGDRGVDVKIIVERSNYNEMMNDINNKTIDWFKNTNVQVRTDPIDEISHQKILIVDDSFMISSMNWGYGGLRQYVEAGALITDLQAVDITTKYFEKLWNKSNE